MHIDAFLTMKILNKSTYLHVLSLKVQPLFAHALVEVVVLEEGLFHHTPVERKNPHVRMKLKKWK